jgi:aminoglycoside phosphotransferase (APT) family kinase protein
MPEARAELDDIAAALRALGAEAIAAARITGLPSPVSDRATFRITLAGGRVVKARRFSRRAKAERYARLVRALGDLPVPPVLARSGRVTIEAWVAGRPLGGLAPTRARLERAADFLAALHATERVGRRRLAARAPTRALVAGVARRLEALVAAGALSLAEARALRRGIQRCAPAAAAHGLTHNDLCAENLVEDARGRLYVVDNGGLRLGFLDLDLARTWYRWPLPAAAWRTFLSRYRTAHPRPLAAEETPFWRIAAVAKSAHFRLARRSPEIEVPLRRLRALTRGLFAGE